MEFMEENESILNNPMSRRWKNILLLLLTGYLAYKIIHKEIESISIEEEGLLGIIYFVFYGFLKVVLILVAIYSSIGLFGKRKKFYILPLLIAITAMAAVITVAYNNHQRDSSAILTHAHYNGDINSLDLKLRKNGSYKFGDYSVLGGTLHYGEYRIEKDTIYLSQKLRKEIGSDKLLIKDSTIFLKQNENGIFIENHSINLKIIYSENE